MEKSVEPTRKKAVVEPSDVWAPSQLATSFLVIGLASTIVFIVVSGVILFVSARVTGSSIGVSPRVEKSLVAATLLCLHVAIPLVLASRFQSRIRTPLRGLLAGAAFGIGGFFLFVFSMLFNSSWRTLGYVLITGLVLTVVHAAFSSFLITIMNKLRPLMPIQDGTLCPQCAYSIIGNTSGVCPECGCRNLPGR